MVLGAPGTWLTSNYIQIWAAQVTQSFQAHHSILSHTQGGIRPATVIRSTLDLLKA